MNMNFYLVKIAVSALLILFISEVARRSTFFGAVLASIPVVSVLAMVWLYLETGDTMKVAALSSGIFWLVLPSLSLFLTLPMLLKLGWGFFPALSGAIVVTIGCYYTMIALLRGFGVTF